MLLLRHVSFYLGLIGLAGALLLVRRQAAQPPDPGPASPPARSPFEERVAATGLIESARENVRVAAPRPGLVTRVFVQVGDDVRRGAPLFQLDDRETRARVAALEAQLAARTAELAVEETLVADWTDQLERVTRLQASQVATEEELRRRQFGLRAAQARVQAGRAGIAAVQAQLEQARTELGVLTVAAPRQGRLLQVNVREGEFAPADTNPNAEPLMLLGDVATLQVRAEVDEQNAVLVSADQPAEASLKGRVDLKIPLRFVRIEPYVVPKRSLTGDSLERVDTRVLQVIFAFDRPSFPVYVGQQVDVFIRRAAVLATRQP